MNILALDIATVTGWAQSRRATVTFGTVEFPGELGTYLSDFESWLMRKLVTEQIEFLAVEAPVPVVGTTNLNVMMRQLGAHGVVHKICAQRTIELLPVSVGTWRKHYLGLTRAPAELTASQRRTWLKKASIAEGQRRGFEVTKDDAADALGVLDYARSIKDQHYAISTTPLFSGEHDVRRRLAA